MARKVTYEEDDGGRGCSCFAEDFTDGPLGLPDKFVQELVKGSAMLRSSTVT